MLNSIIIEIKRYYFISFILLVILFLNFDRYVQFANDECDYGQGLELGSDLFCYGDDSLEGYVKALMPMAYSLLGYSAFERIILAHLNNRSRNTNSYLSHS